MLFVFDGTPQYGAFWNANTLMPLTIAYCGADGTILELRDMRAIQETRGVPELYVPRAAYVTALEMPRGWFARQGVRPGDRIRVW